MSTYILNIFLNQSLCSFNFRSKKSAKYYENFLSKTTLTPWFKSKLFDLQKFDISFDTCKLSSNKIECECLISQRQCCVYISKNLFYNHPFCLDFILFSSVRAICFCFYKAAFIPCFVVKLCNLCWTNKHEVFKELFALFSAPLKAKIE